MVSFVIGRLILIHLLKVPGLLWFWTNYFTKQKPYSQNKFGLIIMNITVEHIQSKLFFKEGSGYLYRTHREEIGSCNTLPDLRLPYGQSPGATIQV